MRMVWEADPEPGTARLRALYPRLVAWHRWWMQTRCDSGAVAVCHPWESGRDNCPDWDVGLANVDGSGAGDYARRDAAEVDGEQRPTKLEYDRYLALVRFGKDCGWDQQTIVERWGTICDDAAPAGAVLWTFSREPLGPSESGWNVDGCQQSRAVGGDYQRARAGGSPRPSCTVARKIGRRLSTGLAIGDLVRLDNVFNHAGVRGL